MVDVGNEWGGIGGDGDRGIFYIAFLLVSCLFTFCLGWPVACAVGRKGGGVVVAIEDK